MIRFGRAICGDLVQAERREWWLADGLGGYAAGTIAGSLTRRYHGLLIAPVQTALDRHLLLARAEATLRFSGQDYPLFTNRWGSGAIEPQGYAYIESFRLDGRLPVWVFSVGGLRIEQRNFMESGSHASWIAFRLLNTDDCDESITLNVRLLANFRDHHGGVAAGGFDPLIDQRQPDHLRLSIANGMAQLHIQASNESLRPERTWISDFLLPMEQQRGLPERDSHLAVASIDFRLNDTNWRALRFGLTPVDAMDPASALLRARGQQQVSDSAHKTTPPAMPRWIEQLSLTARDFLFRRPLPHGDSGGSIIAGYPWFGDWGRDTMIALPGLTLATGQTGQARRILETWAAYVDRGMLPNRFPESGGALEYNSVDAPLWYILAWRQYCETCDCDVPAETMPVLEQIIDAYRTGTRFGIRMDPSDGLVRAGTGNSQLTWMDARVGGIAATPRTGKPVEVNALWCNALRTLQGFCERHGQDSTHYRDLAAHATEGFQRFVREDGKGLYDVLDTPGGGPDASIRPNQVFAVSLPETLLSPDIANRLLDSVRRHLYTSYGLRSLSPDDPAYRGIYQGGVDERDGSYHNGPVWGWLLGHYAMAHFRLKQNASEALALLEPMRDHLFDAGLGSISEIFDGDPPHRPRGAPSQAWSVATVLEAWWSIGQHASAESEANKKVTI